MLTISLLVFTACEDPEPDPPEGPTTPVDVKPVGTVYAAQTDVNAITIQWEESPSSVSSWFEGYELTVLGQAAPIILPANHLSYNCTGLNASTNYTFEVRALGKNTDGTIEKSTPKTIQWALASHFTKNDVGGDIKVYVKESSNYGSGLNLFEEEEAPSNWKVGNGGKWNLALGSKNELIFGTASSVATKIGYNLTGIPVDAEISDPIDFDTDVLDDLALEIDLSNSIFNWGKKYIDLNSSAASSKLKGLVFFARTGTSSSNYHYAKIVVLKKGGKYLQDESTSDPFIQLKVSYQKRAGVPYAKPTN